MSVYRKIKTRFTDDRKLCAALQSLGLQPQTAANPLENSLEIRNSFDALPCAVLVSDTGKYQVGWGGIGFAWNGSEYEVIHDHMYSVEARANGLLADLRQQYAKQELYAAAALNGYTVTEELAPDGSLLLTLNGGY